MLNEIGRSDTMELPLSCVWLRTWNVQFRAKSSRRPLAVRKFDAHVLAHGRQQRPIRRHVQPRHPRISRFQNQLRRPIIRRPASCQTIFQTGLHLSPVDSFPGRRRQHFPRLIIERLRPAVTHDPPRGANMKPVVHQDLRHRLLLWNRPVECVWGLWRSVPLSQNG